MLSERFDDFIRLSEGASAVLWRARQRTDRRRVVLKVLRGPHPSARAIEAFRREFELGGQVSHPALLAPLDFVQGSEPAIVFPDTGAVSCAQLVEDGPLPLAEVLQVARDAAAGLAALHGVGIVHRDLSPDNLVQHRGEGRAWIIDFGLATRRGRDQGPDAARLHGTLAYLSPEQTGRTNRSVDERSDLYTLGATLYHLLCGRPPFPLPDRLQVVHAHLARTPVAPSHLRAEIPLDLSAVVMRCLAKAPEDRYQSAQGLHADLMRCAARWASGDGSPFRPGEDDAAASLRLTETLVGRARELRALRSAFDAAAHGRARLLCVLGWSGIGKTRLVREMLPWATTTGAVWMAGKHELLGRGRPWAGLAQAVGRWLVGVVTDPAEPQARLRERVAEALGDQAPVLASVVPELALLLGPQPEPEALPAAETERRLSVILRRLVAALGRPGAPLVLFLDDLQWADHASLQLLSQLVSDPQGRHLLVVVAWRDHEVPPGHPVLGLVADVEQGGAEVDRLVLEPLSPEASLAFVARSLQLDEATVRPLGMALWGASGGSPFTLGRLLVAMHEDGALRRDGAAWRWSLDDASLTASPDDAVRWLRERLARLDPQARAVASAGAWLGSTFDLTDVASALDMALPAAGRALHALVEAGVVLRVDDAPLELETLPAGLDPSLQPRARFPHDRVQQAASELVARDALPLLRLALARMLAGRGQDRVMEAVGHAAAAGASLEDPAEALRFAALALRAGRMAVGAAAFEVARHHFEAGIAWTGDALWTRDPGLALGLALGAAEASYLDADRAGMERHVARVLRWSRDPVARLRADEIGALAHMSANELGPAIDRAVQALGRAGLHLPATPSLPHVLAGLARTRWALRGWSHTRLQQLPLCTDPLVQARLRVANALFSAAFYGRPTLFPVLAFTLVRESLAHGATPETAIGLCIFGVVRCSLGEIQTGVAFGRSALALNHRLSDRRLGARTEHIWNAHLRFWVDPWQACRDDLKRIHRACWEGGDVEFAAFAAFMSCTLGLHTGESLEALHARNARAIAAIRSLGQQTSLHTTLMHHQILENLTGRADRPAALRGAAYDDTVMESVHRQARDRVNLHCLSVSRAVLGAFCDAWPAAARAMQAADPWDQDARSQPLHVVGRFYDALAHAVTGDLRRARRQLAELRRWAEVGPGNLLHRVHMVEAELAAQEGRGADALAGWEQALRLAEVHDYPHEGALALERLARFHRRAGHSALARMCLSEARQAYARWGAAACVARLDEDAAASGSLSMAASGPARGSSRWAGTTGPESPRMSGEVPAARPRPVDRRSRGTGPGRRSTGTGTHPGTGEVASVEAPLDLEALLAAARRVAGEREAGRVAEVLLEGALLLAGATEVQLWRSTDEGFVRALVAVAAAEGVEVRAPGSSGVQSPLLQEAVRRQLALDPMDPAGGWRMDPVLRSRAIRSALVVPVVHAGRAAGVLLVLHDALDGAFPEARVAPLEALAAQAGIALENAAHWEELDARVRQRTHELLEARREAEAERDRADGLLLNVLPEPIADELKRTGRAVPVSVDEATVLFTDFAGFTRVASELSAEALVQQLERVFAAFDDMVDRFGVTKLKTIGDAYMAVAGLPEPAADHAERAVQAALAMARWVASPDDGGPALPFEVRIGLHTGPLVAGVIGKRRFLYDVWGDTVNVAARMESAGEPGRVNVSHETARRLGAGFLLHDRGLVQAKGKGLLPMFFVEAAAPQRVRTTRSRGSRT